MKEDVLSGRFLATEFGTFVHKREAKSDKFTVSPALFVCVSLYILPDVVMSVCRRCVVGVAMEMGGKARIWEGVCSKIIC